MGMDSPSDHRRIPCQTHFAAFFFVRHNNRNGAKIKRRPGSFLPAAVWPFPLRYVCTFECRDCGVSYVEECEPSRLRS